MNPRTRIFIIALLLNSTLALPQSPERLSEDLVITRISEEVYVATHYFPWDSNSLIVVASPEEVVLIDTPYNTEATGLMLSWIEKELKPQRITAIITGFHIDNLGGNQSLLDQGIPVYGSDLTVTLLREQGPRTLKEVISWLRPEQQRFKAAYEAMVFAAPDRVFNIHEGIVLHRGGLTFEVFFPGETHSPDNLVVYIRELELLFGGCMVKSLSSNSLGFTGDANMQEWPASMQLVRQRYANAQTVIPHHGMWGDMRLVEHTLELLKK